MKTFVGGTVDLKEVQVFRQYASKYYGNNLSFALELAIRCFNDHIKNGEIPMVKRDVMTEFTYTTVKP